MTCNQNRLFANRTYQYVGRIFTNHHKTQLRIAETENTLTLPFSLVVDREAEYHGETRILVNSPKVATYDLQPEMSAFEVTEKLEQAINSGEYDVLVVNYANGDMVGHTGVFSAAVKAVENARHLRTKKSPILSLLIMDIY